MTPKGTPDPEYPADAKAAGMRRDGRNLISEWQQMKVGKVTSERETLTHRQQPFIPMAESAMVI